MTDVTGVRARPGGRVTLRFTGTGYRALPRPVGFELWSERLLGDAAAGISLVLLIVSGGSGGYLWQHDLEPPAVVLFAVCTPCVLLLLARIAVEVVGHLVLFAAVVAAVVFAPLLMFPAVRRRATAWWKRKPAGIHVGEDIDATGVRPVSVTRDGDTVTVTVGIDGDEVRYTATGGEGAALEREFRAMLSRPATGVGP